MSEELADDPVCVCGTELSGHSGWDNHAFVSAEDYYRRPTTEREVSSVDEAHGRHQREDLG